VFSSAFAANIAVMSCFLNKQSRDSVISDSVAVISDELNHRSIIDGVRAASIEKAQKFIYRHLDFTHLAEVLEANKSNFKRAVVVTDGIFSMIGEYTDLAKLKEVTDKYDSEYEEGVMVVVDDSHGVGAFGPTGRGCEDVTKTQVDILVGTFGKAFGCDGGYVVGDQAFMDYLRESAATYIYSNSISPGVAGSALAAVNSVGSEKGKALLATLKRNIDLFKEEIGKTNFQFAAESIHPIQPILIGDAIKTKQLKKMLYDKGILVTNINYPVVAKGKDEIRVQINASHSEEDINVFVEYLTAAGKEMKII
jgi:glycine C-acetyltransferase